MLKSVALASVVLFSSAHAYAVFSFKGSDTLAGPMSDALVAAGLDSQMTYAGGGSSEGEKALVAGTQGIAPMSRAFKADMKDKAKAAGIELIEHVIGLDGVGVFVKADNKTAKLDLETLQKIYTCTITNWEQVEGSGLTGNIVVLRRNDASGTTDTFKSLVGVKDFGACVKVMNETVDIANYTSRDALVIGFAGMTAKTAQNKALALSRKANETAVQPTVSNIRNQSYPLARKLFVYEAAGAVKPNALENQFLDKVLDRSFMDPILQQNEFYTLD